MAPEGGSRLPSTTLTLVISNSINVLMLLLLLYQIFKNTNLSADKAKAYELVILLTVGVMLAEVAAAVFDTRGPAFRIPNIIVNVVGFALSPSIAFVLALVFDETLYRKIKPAALMLAAYGVVVLASPWTGWIFSVSEENIYTRGRYFSIYVAAYIICLLFLIFSNYRQARQWQMSERVVLVMLSVIILIGPAVQVLFPEIHVTWHCVTAVLVMYYVFMRELQFKYDTVTNLLNRQSYKKELERLGAHGHATIILFDLDQFKEINDNYGHTKGDDCLKTTAGIINSSFKKVGRAYRIGGDEFCVLGQNAGAETVQACMDSMLQAINKARKADPVIPIVSYGFSVYDKGRHQNILQAVEEADQKMYACKRNRRIDIAL